MNFDDVIYLILLFLCVGCGPFVRGISNPKEKQFISTMIGLIVVFMVSGLHIIHPVIVTILNALIILNTDKRKCHIYSFVFCFSYLAFFRLSGYIGLPVPPAHTNAVQMMLTLKMVGLAYELNMFHLLKESKQEDKFLKEKYTEINPSFLDVVQYAFCFGGVMIGPYYSYRTYYDAFHAPFAMYVQSEKFVWERISVVPIYASLYLLSSYLFPLEFASSNAVLEEPFWYRVFYMTPIFFNFRMRIYIGFIMGECTCMNMGLGAYPLHGDSRPGAGPRNYEALENIQKDKANLAAEEYTFETVKNIDEFGSEFLPTIREGIRSWNRTVQYWLATFVYKKTDASKPVKILATMLVSSFWHGVHAGYYLCLMSAPLFLVVEREVEKAFGRNVTPVQLKIFHWVWWVIKMQSFSYMGMAFLLLDVHATLHFWKSIYFIGHIFIVCIYVVALCKNRRNRHLKE